MRPPRMVISRWRSTGSTRSGSSSCARAEIGIPPAGGVRGRGSSWRALPSCSPVRSASIGLRCSLWPSSCTRGRRRWRYSAAGSSAVPCVRAAFCRSSKRGLRVRPDRNARPEYLTAFREIVDRIRLSLADLPQRVRPVRMYVAGGAALHLYTGERVSRDIDATFSHRIALPENLEVAYRDADGAPRVLYFDRQYNDAFGLLHEAAYEDSVPLALSGLETKALEVRLLSALDL